MDFFYLVASHRQPYQSIFKSGCAAAVVLVSALDVLPVLINTDQLLIPILLRPISIVWHSEHMALPPQPDRRWRGCSRLPSPCAAPRGVAGPQPHAVAAGTSPELCDVPGGAWGQRNGEQSPRGWGHHGEQLKERGRARRAGGVPCEV